MNKLPEQLMQLNGSLLYLLERMIVTRGILGHLVVIPSENGNYSLNVNQGMTKRHDYHGAALNPNDKNPNW
uniref:Uncharacterized protein n=1 Tax=Caenorhabditis japonica TaxID=281687 RepID=A0A8R1IN33_CAEJA